MNPFSQTSSKHPLHNQLSTSKQHELFTARKSNKQPICCIDRERKCTKNLWVLWRLHMNCVSEVDVSLHFLALTATQHDCVKPGGGRESSQELFHEDQDIRYDLSSTQRHAVLRHLLPIPVSQRSCSTGRVEQRGKGTSLHSHS